MLDLEKMLQRIQNLTSEEWNRIMKESLDAAHIEYSETPGEVIFNGFSPELFHLLKRGLFCKMLRLRLKGV